MKGRPTFAVASPRTTPPSAGASPQRLSIAFFTDSYEPTHDGVAQVTATLARALRRLGHEVTVFTVRSPGQARAERTVEGVRVRRFTAVAAPRYPQYRIALTPAEVLLRFRFPFDVVHVHTPGFVGLAGWLAARRGKLPAVGTYHTNLTDLLRDSGSTRPTRAFFRAWSRFSIDLCRRCDLSTAPTREALAPLLDPAAGSQPAPARLVPNGVDIDRFWPGARDPDWHARLGFDEQVPLVTYLGRLTRDKGVGRFLDAIAQLDRTRRWVAAIGGVGPEEGTVRAALARDPGLAEHLRFLGSVPEAEKPALLSATRVFVLPSLSDTSSVALLEAMASGAACVVTSVGGPSEIARRSGTGLLVDPRDPRAIARAIALLLDDPHLAGSGTAARDWVVENASSDQMATAFEECYREVLARRGSGRA